MGSGGVTKVGPEDALGGPGAAKSAQGPEGPRKGQGDPFLGVPFGPPIWFHLCPQVRSFFHGKKIHVFKYQNGLKIKSFWLKFGSQNQLFFMLIVGFVF